MKIRTILFTLNQEPVALYNVSLTKKGWFAYPHTDSFGFLLPDMPDMPDLKVMPYLPDLTKVPDLSNVLKIPDVPDLPVSPPFLSEVSEIITRQGFYDRILKWTDPDARLELTDRHLMETLLNSGKENDLAIRSLYPLFPYNDPYKVVQILPLSGTSKVTELLSPNVKRKISKALKNGIVVKHGGVELLDDFYPVYRMTIHRHGSFGLTRRYITRRLNETESLSSGNNIKIRLFVAYLRNGFNSAVPVGSAILMTQHFDGSDGFSENSAFATDPQYNALYPSYALHHAMLEYAIQQNCRVYSLGRSTPGSGIDKYKRQWGGMTLPLYYSTTTEQMGNQSVQLGKKLQIHRIIRILPMWCSRIFDGFVNKRVF